MNERILFVDDDPHILQAFQRTLRKRFDLDTAVGPEEGLQKVTENGPYAVIVSDMRMPNMTGVEFLREARKIHPDTVRMILTGNADQQSAIDAVNEGYIFRFLTKPCPADVLVRALEAGLQQYRLITAEKELLTSTLAGCIRVLTEILSLVAPEAFGRAVRARELVSRLCRELNVPDAWQIEIATMLAPIGCVAMPEEIVKKALCGEQLKDAEQATYQTHPRIAHDLLSKIPRLEQVARIVAYQEKLYNGAGFPASPLRCFHIAAVMGLRKGLEKPFPAGGVENSMLFPGLEQFFSIFRPSLRTNGDLMRSKEKASRSVGLSKVPWSVRNKNVPCKSVQSVG